MNVFFTADTHYGHINILKYTNRPFSSVDEMNETMVANWNGVVGDADLVYHLGDFTLGGIDEFWKWTNQLKGNIRIVPGGHDERWLKQFVNLPRVVVIDPLVSLQFEKLRVGKYAIPVVLCHYPLLSWDRSHYGSIHLHGHTHGTIGCRSLSGDVQLPPNQLRGMRIDVGVDCHNFTPISLDEVIGIVNE